MAFASLSRLFATSQDVAHPEVPMSSDELLPIEPNGRGQGELITHDKSNGSMRSATRYFRNAEDELMGMTSDSDAEEEGSECSTPSSEFNDSNAGSLLSSLTAMLWSRRSKSPEPRDEKKSVDDWIPSDNDRIVMFPDHLKDAYKKIYPVDDDDDRRTINGYFHVVGAAEVADGSPVVFHLVFTLWKSSDKQRHSFSIFRHEKIADVTALCERCRESRDLFKILPDDSAEEHMRKLLTSLREHLLWKSAHIAACCSLIEHFRCKGRRLKNCLRLRSQPEGRTALLIAVQCDNEEMVGWLLEAGADIRAVDSAGWNALHIAATHASPSMIQLLFSSRASECGELLHATTHDGCTPLYLAISSVNPRCASQLVSFGAHRSPPVPNPALESPIAAAMKNKNMTASTLRALLDSCPSWNERCPHTGNTLLHMAAHKMPLLALLELKGDEVDMEAKNAAGETALHSMVHKGDLGCVMALCAYKVNLNARDSHGNTPLHVAVSKKNVEMARVLLCLGAEANASNNHEETPRHLAAKFKDSERGRELVRSLVICGARSCSASKRGCTVGCMHRSKLVGDARPALSSQSAAVTMHCVGSNDRLSERSGTPGGGGNDKDSKDGDSRHSRHARLASSGKLSNVASSECLPEEDQLQREQLPPGAPTAPYEFTLDADDGEPDAAYCEDEPVRSWPQKMAIARVLGELHAMAERAERGEDKGTPLIAALSLDGGGIKGLMLVQLLICLQRYLPEPVVSYFDWIAGTSTGTFVAANLVLNRSLREAQQLYLRFKDRIFTGWSRPYNTAVLEELMKAAFNENITLADVPYPRLCFTTVRADVYPVQLELQRNYKLPVSDEENEQLGFGEPRDTMLWRACRRSSAAPTYFSASEGKYIDGGMVSNNPTLDLLSEIHFWNSTCAYQSSVGGGETVAAAGGQVQLGCVLSLGTGVTPVADVDPSLFEMADVFGMLRGIRNLGAMVLDQVTTTEGAPISRSRSWCHALGVPYFRMNVPLFKDLMLDTNDETDLGQIMWDCVVYAHTHTKDFEDLAELLKAIGTNRLRRRTSIRRKRCESRRASEEKEQEMEREHEKDVDREQQEKRDEEEREGKEQLGGEEVSDV